MGVMTDIALDRWVTESIRIAAERRAGGPAAGVPVLDVVVPVYNEQAALADSVHRLHRHLREQFPVPGAHHDRGQRQHRRHLANRRANWPSELSDVRVVRLEQKGRGRALHAVWSTSDAPVLAYMDVDLSTDLAALAPLVAPLISGHSDLAIGTRLGRGARVVRGAKREIISRCYNLILKSTLAAGFSDAQCGFKAIRTDVARAPAAARLRHRLVLRHRAAGARGAQRAAHPRSPGRLGGRSGQPGRHRRHRHRRPQGHRAAAARFRERIDPGEHDCRAAGFVARCPRRPDRCSGRRCGSGPSVSCRPRRTWCCSC